MGLPVARKFYTIREYLESEATARFRSEYHDGEILAMAGGTFRHSAIVMNTGSALLTRLRGTPCRPMDSNLRVRIPSLRSYVYPDLSIVCGPAKFDADDPRQTTITNPRVVIEVLSETTEAYDRGRKFELYRELESLEEYVLIAQDEPLVDTFRRTPDGNWHRESFRGPDATAAITSLGLSIPLAELYANSDPDNPASP
jgi:Uma2 family endonuclease